MNKLKTLFTASPIVATLVSLLIVGAVSAAILGVYVTATGTATVEQSVVFGDDSISKTYTFDAMAGDTYTEGYNLKNRSETTAPIKLQTTQCVAGSGVCTSNPGNDEEGIETSYWSTVELENKDISTWSVIGDSTRATLTYELVSSAFNYELEATGLTPDIEYSLIYYADQQDRFVSWGGDNPGALIVAGMADENGELGLVGSNNLAMNLPQSADWNGSADADYCDNANGFDDYDLCRGAKVWLVPSSEYDAGAKTVSWADPTSYLYETDLMVYDDVDSDGEALYLGHGMLNFFIKNVFAINVAPGTYTIKTEVQPVQ